MTGDERLLTAAKRACAAQVAVSAIKLAAVRCEYQEASEPDTGYPGVAPCRTDMDDPRADREDWCQPRQDYVAKRDPYRDAKAELRASRAQMMRLYRAREKDEQPQGGDDR